MLLCDIGNTSYHFQSIQTDYKEDVNSFLPQSVNQTVYYICVNPKINKLLIDLDNWIDVSQYIDMKNYYETMGVDRIIACEAIVDGVIIDAGSAITVDVVKKNIFEGGFIYPGTVAMAKTYKDISSALEYPFNFQIDLNSLPKNSQDAISYGYLKTLYTEVNSLKQSIYLTGGDAEKLLFIFPNAIVEKNLIFNGMKKVLERVL